MNQTQGNYSSFNNFSATGTQRTFFRARVMNPGDVERATVGHPAGVKERTNGRWHLCGDVSTEMFFALKSACSDETPMRITAFDSPAGGRYCVVSQQVRSFAHRFLLPLYEPCVRAFLLGVRKGDVGLLLGREGQHDALLLGSYLDGAGFSPLVAMTDPLPLKTQRAVLLEMPLVIDAMFETGQVPSLRGGERVLDVSVSVLVPAGTLGQLLNADGER